MIGHGKYGQTIGKIAMDIQVLDINEMNLIGYRRAFVRESIWVVLNIVFIIYYSIESFKHSSDLQELRLTIVDGLGGISILLWFLLEIVTVLFNPKRRAVHDYIAGSVVIKLSEMKREQIIPGQHQIISSPRDK